MADVGVFGRYKNFNDFQQEAAKNNLAEVLAQAQIQNAKVNMAKALKPEELDIEKIGKAAFAKAYQKIPLDEKEKAGLAYLVNSKKGSFINPETGQMEQKPSILEGTGISLNDIMGQGAPSPIAAPMATSASPQKTPIAQSELPMPNQSNAANITALFDPAAVTNKSFRSPQGFVVSNERGGVTINNPDDAGDFKPNPMIMQTTGGKRSDEIPAQGDARAARDAAMERELAQYPNNPLARKTIRDKYINANSPTTIFDQENKLRDEFTATTKNFRTLQDAYSKMTRISDSAAGDIALLYATAKLNDPESVVRESEFAVQASAGSFGDRIKNLVGKIESGQRLTESQRQQLKEEAGNLYKGQLEGYERTKKSYTDIAKRAGLDVSNIVIDYSATPALPTVATPIKPATYIDKEKAARDLFTPAELSALKKKYKVK